MSVWIFQAPEARPEFSPPWRRSGESREAGGVGQIEIEFEPQRGETGLATQHNSFIRSAMPSRFVMALLKRATPLWLTPCRPASTPSRKARAGDPGAGAGPFGDALPTLAARGFTAPPPGWANLSSRLTALGSFCYAASFWPGIGRGDGSQETAPSRHDAIRELI
jgi:hypothetical protein